MRHAFTAAGVLSVVLAAALNLRGPMPPLQDFNEWIYQGWLIGQLMRGEDVPFGLKPWPVPNGAAQVILALLNLMLSPKAAGIAYLMLYLAGMTWLARAIAGAQGRFNPATFLLAILIGCLNSPYWDGYANSQLGTALYLLHVLRQRHGPTPMRWDVAMGFALFFCHAVLLAVFALHTAIHAWQHRLAPRALAVLAPPFMLLAWYIGRDGSYGELIPPFGTTMAEFLAYKAYTAAKTGPYQNLIMGGIGDADRAPTLYLAGVAVNLGFVAVAVLPLVLCLLRDILGGQRTPAHLTALACLAGFAILPSALFGVVNVGERLLIPALLVALVATPDHWNMRRFGAGLAAVSPMVLVHFHLIVPAVPPAGEISHLAAHDASQRMRVLFWHRPYYFHTQFHAAQRGVPVGLGFGTSVLTPRPPAAVAR